MTSSDEKKTLVSVAPPSGPRRSVPPPPPSQRRLAMPPPLNLRFELSLQHELPDCSTVQSLETWSTQGRAGDTLCDAYAARAALAYGCRYGLNRFGRMIYVYLPGFGKDEYEIQSRSSMITKKTVIGLPVIRTLLAMCPKQEDTRERVELWVEKKIT